jgi:tetratricopeptide (TPR) repeat protein
LVHHGYAPDELSARSKRERNLRILRKVRDAGTADAYDLYKLATTLPPWEPTPERSRSLEQAWTVFLVQARDQRDSYPWWPTLARACALDLARQGRFGSAWALLETPGPANRSIAATRAEILLRAGRYGEALDQARRACEIEPDSGLSARDGKETARMWHLAARCARAAGGDPTPVLERAVLEGSLEARCDLALDKIRQKDPSGWKDLDLVLRAHSAHPVVLLAASEAARWQGDRSTSDLLLAQAAKTPSEAGERAQARQWMRAWLEGNRPAFELPPSEIETVAAQGIDRIRSGREWRPDPFLDPRVLRSCLADILEALLHAGHEEAIRSFARNAVGRDGDFPGLSTLVEGS